MSLKKKGGRDLKTKKVPSETKVRRDTSFSGGGITGLTTIEREILGLWSQEFLTPLQIALRRGTSVRAVQMHIRNIKKKGGFFDARAGLRFFDPTCEGEVSDGKVGESKRSGIRLHSQHFVVEFIDKDDAYEVIRKRGNIQYHDGVTVKLHREKLELIGGPGVEFWGSSAFKATAESMQFWNRLLNRLEGLLGVVLIKPRYQNVRCVGAHYARVNCGLAREALDQGDRVRLFAREDGRLWFTIDNSFNLAESETLHPDTGMRDMADVIEPHLNDWRDHPGLWRQSELQLAVQASLEGLQRLEGLLTVTVQSQGVLTEQLRGVVTILQALLPQKEEEVEDRPGKPPFYVG